MQIGKYLKAAFLNHWNLLAFLGGSAFALLSPIPDAMLALVAAGDPTFGLDFTSPFQASVEARSRVPRQPGCHGSGVFRITSPKDFLIDFLVRGPHQQIAAELGQKRRSADPWKTSISGLDRAFLWFISALFAQIGCDL